MKVRFNGEDISYELGCFELMHILQNVSKKCKFDKFKGFTLIVTEAEYDKLPHIIYIRATVILIALGDNKFEVVKDRWDWYHQGNSAGIEELNKRLEI